jgi:hypothetical protein
LLTLIIISSLLAGGNMLPRPLPLLLQFMVSGACAIAPAPVGAPEFLADKIGFKPAFLRSAISRSAVSNALMIAQTRKTNAEATIVEDHQNQAKLESELYGSESTDKLEPTDKENERIIKVSK